MEETYVLRIFERETVRKIHRPVRGERWSIRTNKDIKGLLQVADKVKVIKCVRLGWYGQN